MKRRKGRDVREREFLVREKILGQRRILAFSVLNFELERKV